MHRLARLIDSNEHATLTTESRNAVAHRLGEALHLEVYPGSIVFANNRCYLLGRDGLEKKLIVLASQAAYLEGFQGDVAQVAVDEAEFHSCIGPTSVANAQRLREHLPFLRPKVLGLAKSVGCGDRLGLATPGHVAALRQVQHAREPAASLIAAQQSVRENARTGRTPQQVLDEAMWGVFESGWRAGYGADADHLKQPEDVAPWVDAGFTFYTIDPGEHVDDEAEAAKLAALREKVAALPWELLDSDPKDLLSRFSRPFDLGIEKVTMNETDILRAAAKYGHAVAHTVRMYRHIQQAMAGRPFELEVSVDETATVTRVEEHIYIASELRRLGVKWVSLAPRYVGAFEKGVDYIGDAEAFRRDFARHASVARLFGPYKLSLHSGSDKFTIYPIAAEIAGDLVHLKTAGTSYLEALRTVAHAAPDLFREILQFALDRYEVDRASYHVSGKLDRVPPHAGLKGPELAALLDQFDARQVLHVTFGSVLQDARLKAALYDVLRNNEELHYQMLRRHFVRHLSPFVSGVTHHAGGTLAQDA